jgi:CBS domain-containing protein
MDKILKRPVKEFMTKQVISVNEHESIKDLFKLMDKHDILGVPVVDKDGALAGIVTESDLIEHFTTLKNPRSLPILGTLIYLDDISDFNKNLKEHCAEIVQDIMTEKVISLNEDATLQDAIDLMAQKHVNRLPVTAKSGKLAGIVTRSDIIHELAKLTRP